MREAVRYRASPALAGADIRRHRWTVPAIVAVALLAWPFNSLTPGIDGDWGWVAALSVATKDGLPFGDGVIWTYGPLGILEAPILYYDTIAMVAFAYQWIVQLLLAGTIYLAGRRSYPSLVAAIVAFIVVAVEPSRGITLGFAWCMLAVARPDGAPRDRLGSWFPPAIGALAGVMVLGKLNFGVEIVVLAAIALACRPGRRLYDAATFAGVLLAVAGIGWLATGQSLADVWPYLRYGTEIIRGYAAMQGVPPTGEWVYGAALLVLAVPSALVWAQARAGSRRRGWGLVALWAIYAYASFKEGFIRADDPHIALFAASMLPALGVLPPPPGRRWAALAGVGIAASLAFLAALNFNSLVNRLDPLQNATAAADQVRTLSSGSRRREIRERHIEEIRLHYGLPDTLIREIGRNPVAFWPYSYGDLVYAYSPDWRPLPVLEPSHAYTPALDRAAADLLASPQAPARILRRAGPAADALGMRPYEPPLSTRAIFCRYRELGQRDGWQLLARSANRCGEPQVIATVDAPWGQPVEVPRGSPRSAVLAKIEGTEPAGVELLKALWLRPDARVILIDGRPSHLIPATAPEGIFLGASRNADYPPPFALAPNPKTVAVARVGGQPDGMLRYAFFELPVEPPRHNSDSERDPSRN